MSPIASSCGSDAREDLVMAGVIVRLCCCDLYALSLPLIHCTYTSLLL